MATGAGAEVTSVGGGGGEVGEASTMGVAAGVAVGRVEGKFVFELSRIPALDSPIGAQFDT